MDIMRSGIYFLRLHLNKSDVKFNGWYHLKENLYKVGRSQKATGASRGVVMVWEDG